MASTIRFNSSRNPWIDAKIVPQPYKEVLPCQDLCFELVKSCPAALQFVCPKPDWMLRRSYGVINNTALQDTVLTCNWPNVDLPGLGRAGAAAAAARMWVAVGAAAASMLVLGVW